MNEQLPDFDGETYEAELDKARLATALGRVWLAMRDGKWHTLAQLSELAGCSEAGASARVRDLRKEKFREHYPNSGIESRRHEQSGLWVYRMLPAAPKQMELFA